jgi:hypothetical protein
MKSIKIKIKRALIIIAGSLMLILFLGICLISPLAKYLIEKYDGQYTGRQITMGWLYINPFTGYFYASDLKIYESKSLPALVKSDTLFFSAKGLGVDFAMLKLPSKTIEITNCTLNQPRGIIIQNKRDLNFNDLIRRFSAAKPGKTSSQVHVNILGIKIKNGSFYYNEKGIPVKYFIKDVNFESKGKYWKADTVAVKFSLSSGTGSGTASGRLTLNLKNLDYKVVVVIHEFDLKFMEQYLRDLANYAYFSANLDADIKASGNITDQENLNAAGLLQMNDFHFGRNLDEDYVSFDKLVLKIDSLSPKNHQYVIDSLSLTHPFLKYERYDDLDNLQRMFGKNGANISAAKADPARFNLILQISDYIKVIAKNFFQSDYRINKLAIYKGDLRFSDYSLAEKFTTEANPLFIVADSVNKNRKRVKASIKTSIQPYGNIAVNLSVNPRDSGDFDIQYHFRSLPVSLFNPYLITYTSFPMDGGTIELNGNWKVRNSIIESDNHLLVIDPRITKRKKNKDAKWIPSPLIMSFIREQGNVIDYEIPITGNLKSPKFHLHDVIMDILGNIFVKPATIPYRAQVKTIENEIEKSLTLQWEMRQSSQRPDQNVFVNKITDFLIRNPKASINVYPMQYAVKEKEYILFFEAKKRYFLLSGKKDTRLLSYDDSMKVDKMSVKDHLFLRYINNQVNDTMLFTIQDKCNRFVGPMFVNTRFKQLNKEREIAFMSSFRKKNLEKRVNIHAGENTVPYNGFSFYKIVYEGELPEYLIKAYRQLNELNNISPRKRFKKEREMNKSKL